MKWIAKAAAQKLISWMPFKIKINFFFQRYVTKGYILDSEHYGYKITHAKDHWQHIRKFSTRPLNDLNVLEIGSGWFPIVPIFYSLHGVKNIVTVDLYPHLTISSMHTALESIRKDDSLKLNSEQIELLERCENLEDLDAILELLNIDYRVGDITTLDLNTSFDVISSNNTFEHIGEDSLKKILSYFERVLSEDGIMTHFIDMSDHYSHFDKKIGPYNFLKYSKKFWNMIDNSIQPQNRMRFVEYKELHKTFNFDIVETIVWDYVPGLIELVRVHSDFDRFSKEELQVLHAYIISKKKSA